MKVTKSITIDRTLWYQAVRQAETDEVTIDIYLTWLITRDRQGLPLRRREDKMKAVNNTLQHLLEENSLTTSDEFTALHTLELVEEILSRIGSENIKAALSLAPRTHDDDD